MTKRLLTFLRSPLGRELLLYGIFGGITTIVAFGSYWLFLQMELHLAVANVLSHAVAIVFAFIVNKIWVFTARDFSLKVIAGQFCKFAASRLIVMVLETGLLMVLVEYLGVDALVAKFFTTILVMVMNYLAGKFIVFGKKSENPKH